MKSQIPVARLVAVAVCALLSVVLFVFLNNRFGGPRVPPSHPYELRARFPDTQNLVRKSLVMIRGVRVGEVTDVKVVHGVARVSFTVDDEYRPVPVGSRAQVGHRTVFGEAIINLLRAPAGGDELPSGSTIKILTTVQPDEALQVLGPDQREDVAAGARELADGLRDPRAAERLSRTYAGTWDAVGELRRMTDALRGQQAQIADLVTSSATVAGVLGRRERQIASIVGDARTVAETWAGEAGSVRRGVVALHALLDRARGTLARGRPLAEQVAATAQRAAPVARDLQPGLDGLRPLVRDAAGTVAALRPANRRAQPLLARAAEVFDDLVPLARGVSVTLANLGPVARYVAKHRGRFGAFISNIADTVDNHDASGGWLHGFLILDPNGGLNRPLACGLPSGLCSNAYPAPDGPVNEHPYERGSYPRLIARIP